MPGVLFLNRSTSVLFFIIFLCSISKQYVKCSIFKHFYVFYFQTNKEMFYFFTFSSVLFLNKSVMFYFQNCIGVLFLNEHAHVLFFAFFMCSISKHSQKCSIYGQLKVFYFYASPGVFYFWTVDGVLFLNWNVGVLFFNILTCSISKHIW